VSVLESIFGSATEKDKIHQIFGYTNQSCIEGIDHIGAS